MKFVALRAVCSLLALMLLLSARTTQAQETILYDFTAAWCGPCQQMKPIVNKLAREGLPIKQIDLDQNADLARKYQVNSIPTFVLVVNGQEKGRVVGKVSEQQLRQMLATIPTQKQASANAGNSTRPTASHSNSGPVPSLQPKLGNPEAFPDSFIAPATVSSIPLLADNASQQPDYRMRNLANPASSMAGTSGIAAPPQIQLTSNPASADARAPGVSGREFSAQDPVIRAQFDDKSEVSRTTPGIDSRAANVRIRIRDDKGINYGSGTLIESRPGVSYVLTCGHIFRGYSDQSKIDVDIFVGEEFESFVGQVEKYDLDADVGLLSIPTASKLPVARLASGNYHLQKGQPVISVGCSGGQNPTVEKLEVTALNRYQGPDNVECTGVPVQGRSGGGLFNAENEIVGVCSAADPKEKRGLYAGLLPILQMVEACGLGHLIRDHQPKTQAPDLVADRSENIPPEFPQTASLNPQTGPAATSESLTDFPADFNKMNSASEMQSMQASQNQISNPELTAQGVQALQSAAGSKLTILIEDPEIPGKTRVVIIPSATARLLADLTGELKNGQAVATHRNYPTPPAIVPSSVTPEQYTQRLPSEHLAQPVTRKLREQDRSETLPTDFSAAQPYRRQQK